MAAESRENRSMTESRREEELADINSKSKEIVAWLTGPLKIKLSKPDNLRESLLDGVVLCQLANALKPNSVKRYHQKPRMLMMKMENIGASLDLALLPCPRPRPCPVTISHRYFVAFLPFSLRNRVLRAIEGDRPFCRRVT